MATKKSKSAKRVWISYDLGLRGNYDALYEWLDEKEAEECGDSIATFQTRFSAEELQSQLVEILGEPLKARIYLIVKERGGRWLIGKRKAAPWAGHFQASVETSLDQ